MSTSNKPAWMEDELVKNIPPKKLEFLEKMLADTQGKSQKELMPLLMPMMKKAKAENLSFTPMEMNAAITAIKKHSTPEELFQIDKILSKSKESHK